MKNVSPFCYIRKCESHNENPIGFFRKAGGNMRIQASTAASRYSQVNYMKRTELAQKKSQEKLASGRKVNRAADDAAVLAISNKLIKQINSLNQGGNNIQDGICVTKIADGAMSSIAENLHDLEANTIRAMNGTMSASDRQIIQDQVDATIGTIDHIKNVTKYNETNLLEGSTKNMRIHTGVSGQDLTLDGVSSAALGLKGFSVTDADAINTETLDNAMRILSSGRSKLGAQANGLESAYRSNQITAENTVAAESRMADTNFAEEIMKSKTNSYIGAAQVLMMRNQMKQEANVTNMLFG